MTRQRVLKTAFAMAATLAASAALAQMNPAPQTAPDAAPPNSTMQAAPEGQSRAASSTDPLVQKRIDDKAANDEYKARKAGAKATYKAEKKAAKANRKAEKKEASVKRKEAMATQGGMTQAPDSEGK
ncbi:hypothetical protein [Ralstonia sp. UBA689]|uniref:hypothetical protein n=1 Tax=Ralstonia sp. UBA689 TaxID=1947373 RepID=UPI0025FC59B3|nr:hypothetical protein [Ralstonia sp. UBA689]